MRSGIIHTLTEVLARDVVAYKPTVSFCGIVDFVASERRIIGVAMVAIVHSVGEPGAYSRTPSKLYNISVRIIELGVYAVCSQNVTFLRVIDSLAVLPFAVVGISRKSYVIRRNKRALAKNTEQKIRNTVIFISLDIKLKLFTYIREVTLTAVPNICEHIRINIDVCTPLFLINTLILHAATPVVFL
jgi:hypothetical protein